MKEMTGTEIRLRNELFMRQFTNFNHKPKEQNKMAKLQIEISVENEIIEIDIKGTGVAPSCGWAKLWRNSISVGIEKALDSREQKINESKDALMESLAAMISRFLSGNTGLINSNSRIDSRIFATWARLCNFGLFLYARMSVIFMF